VLFVVLYNVYFLISSLALWTRSSMMISKRFDVYHNAFTEHSKRGLGAAGLQILLAFQAQTGQLLLEHTANKVLEKVPS